MADAIPGAELEFRVLLLPEISRSAHLDGPILQARRLADLWKVEGDDDLPLAQAFRLLDPEAIAGTILRTLYMFDKDYPSDPRYWTFPSLEDLLPELRDLSWQLMLDRTLSVEAIKGVRGKRHRTVLPAELLRLAPDWELSRLILDGRDEFIDVRVRRAPVEPAKRAWGEHPSKSEVEAAMVEVAKEYPSPQEYPRDAPRPAFDEVWAKLKARLGDGVTRKQARDALKKYPHLRGRRGYRSKGKSPD
jgi:hypothetical protein